ncbi:putative secreted RxLR effector peptide protein [Phytophthora cinnamomi]|uniref:putative secreted RxLR effector peptide protein n=1 Tax=Phytophthora cinnamomi TaxID=4785 RepID=UPI002A301870|nr:putative secreted RxLR effector peptide protein [Phytophthora cinnamomi]KAJ8558916.1 hypothetical protein ON010_g8535 [Phytophthora cinnamomi]
MKSTMRVNFLLALVVATFAATVIGVTSAENVAQVMAPETEAQFVGGEGQVRRLKGSPSAKKLWVSDVSEEERALPLDNAKSFIVKLKGRVDAKKLAQINGVGAKVDRLNNAQIKEVTVATANAVKKDRRIWPYVKEFLKILYGSTLAALIIVGVTAMLH